MHAYVETFALLRVGSASKTRDEHWVRGPAGSQRVGLGRLGSCLRSRVQVIGKLQHLLHLGVV